MLSSGNPVNLLHALVTSRRGLALIGIAALVLVAASVVMTKALDLAPCPLCIFQRMLYLLLGVLVLVGALWPRALPWTGTLALTSGIGGFATASYQTWMQAYPTLAVSCGPTDPNAIEGLVYWAGNQVPWLFAAWGECISREWELLGLSLANWSVLTFLGFTVLIALQLRHWARQRAKRL